MAKKGLLPSVASYWRAPVVDRFHSDIDELFESVFTSIFNAPAVKTFEDIQTNASFPKVNVSETKDCYTVDIAIAGFNKDDVNLELKENTLFIGANKKEQLEEDVKTYLCKEILSRSFNRSVRFPCAITSEVSADYKDGIISISIRKDTKKNKDCGIKIDIN